MPNRLRGDGKGAGRVVFCRGDVTSLYAPLYAVVWGRRKGRGALFARENGQKTDREEEDEAYHIFRCRVVRSHSRGGGGRARAPRVIPLLRLLIAAMDH